LFFCSYLVLPDMAFAVCANEESAVDSQNNM
jgi:hypothetical protein